ncbi:LPS export ABC transporter ATP-binding protein [candidate division WOR-3 bacterium]|nr:LPS export ABC transporter ATP-binding protein [candidate division WOR-3 bacterium]
MVLSEHGKKMEFKKLYTRGLEKKYGNRKVVNSVSLEVSTGEIVGLLGPNGAGKTTTFYMMLGIIKPLMGDIFLDEERITKTPMYMRARKGISYLPQEASIFRGLSVRDNILSVMQLRGVGKKAIQSKLENIMEELDIKHIEKNRGDSLSGGERRRVEIARALVIQPQFLLLDEPFTGIDPIVRSDIQKIVLKLKEKGIGVLITDHNVRETLEITDRAYIMYEGKILLSGDAQTLINDEEAKRLYLGDNFRM